MKSGIADQGELPMDRSAMDRQATTRLTTSLMAAGLMVIGLLGCSSSTPAAAEPSGPRATRRAAKSKAAPKPIEVALPALPPNASCRLARSAYVERWQMEAGDVPPDLSRGQLASVLSSGRLLKACRVPHNVEVRVCAAVHEGRVMGATVKTAPWVPQLVRCLDKRVRALNFPRSPRMDVTNTVFRPSGGG